MKIHFHDYGLYNKENNHLLRIQFIPENEAEEYQVNHFKDRLTKIGADNDRNNYDGYSLVVEKRPEFNYFKKNE